MLNNALKSKIFLVVLCLLPLIPIWYYDYLPLQDYPNHYARLKIRSDCEHSDFYREYFRIELFKGLAPPPYLALDIFVDKIMFFLDTDKAMRLFISLYVILYLISLYLLARQLALDFSLIVLMNIPLIYSYFFHAGLLNFLFSLPMFLFLVWILEKYEFGRNRVYILLVGIFSIITYLTHIFAFFAFCILLFCHLLTKRLKIREYLYILLAIFPSLMFSIDFKKYIGSESMGIHGGAQSAKLQFLNFIFFHLPFIPFLVSCILFYFAIFIILRNSVFTNRRYLGTAIGFLGCYFLLPSMGIDVRALLFSLMVLPLSLKIRESRHVTIARLSLLGIVFIGFFWILISFSNFNKNFSTKCASVIKQGTAILPIDVTKVESAVTPYVNSWGYFLRHRELITPYLFSGFMVEYKKRLPAPSISWVFSHSAKVPYAFTIQYEPLSEEFLNEIKDNYDYILLTGDDQNVKKLIGSVSQETCSSGKVRLYKIDKKDL